MKYLYLKIIGIFFLVTIANFIIFLIFPDKFYYRGYEYCKDFFCLDPWVGNSKGDLSRQNLLFYQESWKTETSFNKYGYRKTFKCNSKPSILFFGDSYVAGAGLSDRDVINFQFTEKYNVPSANFAGLHPFLFEKFNHEEVKYLIYITTERSFGGRFYKETRAPNFNEYIYKPRLENSNLFGNFLSRLNELKRWHFFFLTINFVKRLSNDFHIYFKNDEKEFLQDEFSYNEKDVMISINKIVEINNFFKKKNIKFIYIPIPSKERIYTPNLLFKKYKDTYNGFQKLIINLQKNKIDFIDLRSDFKKSYSNNNHVYYRTDSHWNRLGVQITIDKIFEKINYKNLNKCN